MVEVYGDMQVVFHDSYGEVHFSIGPVALAVIRNDVFGYCWSRHREGFLEYMRKSIRAYERESAHG